MTYARDRTSSSQAVHRRLRHRAPYLLGVVSALLVLSVPLAFISWVADEEPEVRILDTGGRLSALITDGDARMLVINSSDREAALASLGRVAGPWEPRPLVLIAPSDDGAAIGLWEVMRHIEPEHVLVAGIPGAGAIWTAIERECGRRDIHLEFISDRALVRTERLEVTVVGAGLDDGGGRSVVVRRGGINLVLGLDSKIPRMQAQILVTNGDPAKARPNLLITSRAHHPLSLDQLWVRSLDLVRIVIEPHRVRVSDGRFVPAEDIQRDDGRERSEVSGVLI